MNFFGWIKKIIEVVTVIFSYHLGKSNEKKRQEAKEGLLKFEAEQKRNDELTQIIVKGDELREKYDKVRLSIPDSWDDDKLRKVD